MAHKQFRRSLKCIKDNVLIQLLNMSAKSGDLLDLNIKKGSFKT